VVTRFLGSVGRQRASRRTPRPHESSHRPTCRTPSKTSFKRPGPIRLRPGRGSCCGTVEPVILPRSGWANPNRAGLSYVWNVAFRRDCHFAGTVPRSGILSSQDSAITATLRMTLRLENEMRRDPFGLSPRRRASPYGDVPVKVASESYQEFTRWLDHELEELVARWTHVSAPKPSRRASSRRRFVKPR